jgi:hypothetical protein
MTRQSRIKSIGGLVENETSRFSLLSRLTDAFRRHQYYPDLVQFREKEPSITREVCVDGDTLPANARMIAGATSCMLPGFWRRALNQQAAS